MRSAIFMLKTINLSFDDVELPRDIFDFVAELDARVDRFIDGKPFAQDGFVACDHLAIARALIAIGDQELSTGSAFCEWGSGFGGVASVASMLEYEAYGIEINREVLDYSIALAKDFELEVDFIEGSFIPVGSDDLVDVAYMENDGDLTLECHFDDAYPELGLEVGDFDIIFVFPWPNEAPLLARIFDRFASDGALLLTYNDFSGLDIKRKS